MNSMAVVMLLAFAPPAESILTGLPKEAGAFTADPVKSYENPRLGASRTYKGPNQTKIDVYVYDLGVKGIADGIEGEAVQEAFKMARTDIRTYEKRGFYENVKLLTEKPREVTLAPGRAVPLLAAAYTFTIKPSETTPRMALTSYLMVTGLRGQIVKFRIHHPADGQDRDKQIDSLVSQLVKSIEDGN